MVSLHPRILTALVSVDPNATRKAWHGCPTIEGALRGVSADVAVWRPYPESENIREFALHIAFWQNSVARRLAGRKNPLGLRMRKTGWIIREDTPDPATWKAEVDLVRTVHRRLSREVESFDPARLDEPPGTDTTRKAIEFIHGVAEHTLYHTAQIQILKELASNAGVG
jgi:hypothetical protein